MKQRLNNAKTLQRRHFLTGAAGTLLVPLAGAQTAPSPVRSKPGADPRPVLSAQRS